MSTDELTPLQKMKIYDDNFEEFINKPAIVELEKVDVIFMGEQMKNSKDQLKLLPLPAMRTFN